MAVEVLMRKPRKLETAEDRQKRLERIAQDKITDDKKADAALDARIRQNIKFFGP